MRRASAASRRPEVLLYKPPGLRGRGCEEEVGGSVSYAEPRNILDRPENPVLSERAASSRGTSNGQTSEARAVGGGEATGQVHGECAIGGEEMKPSVRKQRGKATTARLAQGGAAPAGKEPDKAKSGDPTKITDASIGNRSQKAKRVRGDAPLYCVRALRKGCDSAAMAPVTSKDALPDTERGQASGIPPPRGDGTVPCLPEVTKSSSPSPPTHMPTSGTSVVKQRKLSGSPAKDLSTSFAHASSGESTACTTSAPGAHTPSQGGAAPTPSDPVPHTRGAYSTRGGDSPSETWESWLEAKLVDYVGHASIALDYSVLAVAVSAFMASLEGLSLDGTDASMHDTGTSSQGNHWCSQGDTGTESGGQGSWGQGSGAGGSGADGSNGHEREGQGADASVEEVALFLEALLAEAMRGSAGGAGNGGSVAGGMARRGGVQPVHWQDFDLDAEAALFVSRWKAMPRAAQASYEGWEGNHVAEDGNQHRQQQPTQHVQQQQQQQPQQVPVSVNVGNLCSGTGGSRDPLAVRRGPPPATRGHVYVGQLGLSSAAYPGRARALRQRQESGGRDYGFTDHGHYNHGYSDHASNHGYGGEEDHEGADWDDLEHGGDEVEYGGGADAYASMYGMSDTAFASFRKGRRRRKKQGGAYSALFDPCSMDGNGEPVAARPSGSADTARRFILHALGVRAEAVTVAA